MVLRTTPPGVGEVNDRSSLTQRYSPRNERTPHPLPRFQPNVFIETTRSVRFVRETSSGYQSRNNRSARLGSARGLDRTENSITTRVKRNICNATRAPSRVLAAIYTRDIHSGVFSRVKIKISSLRTEFIKHPLRPGDGGANVEEAKSRPKGGRGNGNGQTMRRGRRTGRKSP